MDFDITLSIRIKCEPIACIIAEIFLYADYRNPVLKKACLYTQDAMFIQAIP